MAESERLHILEMIESGTITAEQGILLIKALDAGTPEVAAIPEMVSISEISQTPRMDAAGAVRAAPAPESVEPPTAESASPAEEVFAPEPEDAPESDESPVSGHLPENPHQARFRRFWMYPLWIGAGITVLGALLMFTAWQSSGFGFWFACTWFPFLVGVGILALAWASRTAPWVHVRVRQRPGEFPQNISISLPLPLGLAGWAANLFKDRIPDTGNGNPAEMIGVLKHVTPDKPLYVEVDDEDGEHVEVYIG